MDVKVIRDAEQWDELEYAWRKLVKICRVKHPFLDWNWIRAWIDRLPKDNIAPILIVVKDQQGNVVGLAPFQISGITLFKYIEGFAQEFCDYIDWLIIPDLEIEVGEEIIKFLKIAREFYTLIRIRNIFPEGPAHRILKRHLPGSLKDHGIAPEVTIVGTFNEYLKSLKAKFVSDTKRRERKLIREVGEVEYAVIRRNEEIPAVVENIAKWLSLRRNENKGTSYFDKNNMKEHFVSLYQKLNSLGMLHLSGFSVNGRFIAMNVAFKYENSLFSYTPVFDSRYSKYSVMRLLKIRNIEECYLEKRKLYDLCLGGEEYKYDFNPTIKQLYEMNLYGSNIKGNTLKVFETKIRPILNKSDRIKKVYKTMIRNLTFLKN